MENESALVLPFVFLALGIPFGFFICALVHGLVAIPRWIVENAC